MNIYLVLFGLAELPLWSNLWTGWRLSHSETLDPSPTLHLLAAIAALILLAAGFIGLYRLATERLLRLSGDPAARSIAGWREKALVNSFGTAACILLSLISGTVTTSGRLPWLHALLGVAGVMIHLRALFAWVRFTLLTAKA